MGRGARESVATVTASAYVKLLLKIASVHSGISAKKHIKQILADCFRSYKHLSIIHFCFTLESPFLMLLLRYQLMLAIPCHCRNVLASGRRLTNVGQC